MSIFTRAISKPTLVLAWSLAASLCFATPPALRVDVNQLKDARGKVVRLQGVNVPSLDWSATGEHLFESIDAAIGGWNARIIRIPLSQDLWYGYPRDVPSTGIRQSADKGNAYRKLVDQVVQRIASKNCYVLLDLHWSDGGVWGQKVGQHCMPDDNSLTFWKNCATRYANHPAVLFDLYNEPYDVSWEVWQKGGQVEERNDDPSRGLHLSYHSPGMQALLDEVRKTGAKNIVVAGGLDWAYDLRGINDGYALNDRGGRGIMYGTHIYPWKKDWDAHVTPIIAKHPVFVGEVGCNPWKPGDPEYQKVDCATWAPSVLEYINRHNLNWTAWSFHPSASPCLITGFDYKPTPYWGTYVKSALAQARGAKPVKLKRTVIWNGEDVDKGASWTNPTSSTLLRTKAESHSGTTSLEFKFHESHIWIGCGFDWMMWKTGRDVGTDSSQMKNLTFWIKSKGKTGALEVQLLCNGDVVDTPEHHAPKMKIADYCPNFRDGAWHQVVIPLADMAYPIGYDPKVVTMIDFGFMAEGEANGSFFIDDIAFDNLTYSKGTK